MIRISTSPGGYSKRFVLMMYLASFSIASGFDIMYLISSDLRPVLLANSFLSFS